MECARLRIAILRLKPQHKHVTVREKYAQCDHVALRRAHFDYHYLQFVFLTHISFRLHPCSTQRGDVMNRNQIAGKWEQAKGEAQRQWGKLTGSQLDQVKGDAKKLAGLVRESYGISEEEAQKQVDNFFDKYEVDDKNAA